MKESPKTELEKNLRTTLEVRFPDTVSKSRKGRSTDWKRAIIDYLYNEAKLAKIEIARVLKIDHTTVLYHLKNELCCKEYDRFKNNVFNQFREELQ